MATQDRINRWIRQARHDLAAAEAVLGIGIYDNSAFLAQQAVEKMLKAVFIAWKGYDAPRTHSLTHLAQELGAPETVLHLTQRLSPDYVATRYPDVSELPPCEEYTEEDARKRLEWAKQVFTWLEQLMGQQL